MQSLVLISALSNNFVSSFSLGLTVMSVDPRLIEQNCACLYCVLHIELLVRCCRFSYPHMYFMTSLGMTLLEYQGI